MRVTDTTLIDDGHGRNRDLVRRSDAHDAGVIGKREDLGGLRTVRPLDVFALERSSASVVVGALTPVDLVGVRGERVLPSNVVRHTLRVAGVDSRRRCRDVDLGDGRRTLGSQALTDVRLRLTGVPCQDVRAVVLVVEPGARNAVTLLPGDRDRVVARLQALVSTGSTDVLADEDLLALGLRLRTALGRERDGLLVGTSAVDPGLQVRDAARRHRALARVDREQLHLLVVDPRRAVALGAPLHGDTHVTRSIGLLVGEAPVDDNGALA